MARIYFTGSIDYRKIYRLFDESAVGAVTPLTADCGTVCGGACCRDLSAGCGDAVSPSGMLLFPHEGEESAPIRENWPEAQIFPAGQDSLFVCGGHCPREKRPLACRLFPLFPYDGEDGRIRAVYDPRAWRVCPLVRERAHVPLRRDFVRAVCRTGRLVARTEEGRGFLKRQSEEIDEINRFLRLDRERAPICRKSLRGDPAAERMNNAE